MATKDKIAIRCLGIICLIIPLNKTPDINDCLLFDISSLQENKIVIMISDGQTISDNSRQPINMNRSMLTKNYK